MYTIYSTLTVSIICCIVFGIIRHKIKGELTSFWFEGSLIFTIVLTVVSGLISIAISNYVPDKEKTYGPFPLTAARTSDGINGAFIWGSGSIGSQAIYHVLVKNNNGSSTPYNINADNLVEIFEDSPSEHEGTWIIVKREKDWTAPIAKWATNTTSDQGVVIKQELHVPKGSIVQNFSLQ